MKKVRQFVMLLAFATTYSCSNGDDVIPSSCDKTVCHQISIEKAKKNALDFVQTMGTETRSHEHTPTIKNVVPYTVQSISTRGSSKLNDTIFYIVDFDNDEGFVLAAADDRHVPVFAYIDENSYDEEKENKGFSMFVSAIVKSYNEDGGIALKPKESNTNSLNSNMMVTPRLLTKWGQSYPYGQFCSNGLAGFKNVALAQICSFLMEPAGVAYQNNGVYVSSDIDWDSIISDAYQNNGDLTGTSNITQVAHLMRYWGYEDGSSYQQGHTETVILSAVAALRNSDFEVSNNQLYSGSSIISELNDVKNIILMRGYENSYDYDDMNGGYLWLVDGYFAFGSTKYLHCNWGNFGYHDGYYLDNVFDYMSGPEIETRFSGYYNMNLLYNVITKD